jgi:cytochrome P450
MHAFPVSSLDPFADDFLAAPYPFYAELREAGPEVWLERYGLWACARHAEVQAALSDWQTFSSAAGRLHPVRRRNGKFRDDCANGIRQTSIARPWCCSPSACASNQFRRPGAPTPHAGR